jgi:AcrR family transcriptional regulator
MPSNVRHGTPEEGRACILQAARQRYRCGQRIELTQLAAEQGIGRATAYRWFGDNDRLLAEILAERIRENFAVLLRENAGKVGRDKVLSVVEGFLRYAARSERLESLLRSDQRRILKILATSSHGVQQMVVELFEHLLGDEQAAGHIFVGVPNHTLAYGIVRLIEAYLYTDGLTGETRDIDTAVQLIGLLVPAESSGSHYVRRPLVAPRPRRALSGLG